MAQKSRDFSVKLLLAGVSLPSWSPALCYKYSEGLMPLLRERLAKSQIEHLNRFSPPAGRCRLARILARIAVLEQLPKDAILNGPAGRPVHAEDYVATFSYSQAAAFSLIGVDQMIALDAEPALPHAQEASCRAVLRRIIRIAPEWDSPSQTHRLWVACEACHKMNLDPARLAREILLGILDTGLSFVQIGNDAFLSFLEVHHHLVCVASKRQPALIECDWQDAEELTAWGNGHF